MLGGSAEGAGGAGGTLDRRSRRRQHLVAGTAALALVVSVAALFYASVVTSQRSRASSSSVRRDESSLQTPYTAFHLARKEYADAVTTTTTRFAAGSCTSYDLRPQPVWTEGVIPFDPHAWIWLGDMAYLDDAPVDCQAASPETRERLGCVCPADWLRRPGGCFAGDASHAARRAAHQLAVAEYQTFVAHMCSPGGEGGDNGSSSNVDASAEAPHFPPPPSSCRAPILGAWDDHDFGANNGDARNPAKAEVKEIYLDMLGEPRNSARRGSADGLQAEYRWLFRGGEKEGDEEEEAIQLLLTDGRWHREPMPCSRRDRWCRAVLADFARRSPDAPLSSNADAAWCSDFLVTGDPSGAVGGSMVGAGGGSGGGSCCRKDDEWGKWCASAEGLAAPEAHRRALCDPTSREFGLAEAVLVPAAGAGSGTADFDVAGAWEQAGAMAAATANTSSSSNTSATLYRRLVEGADSPLCEVLGQRQRRWLRHALQSSRAPLRIVTSGSVLLGSLLYGQGGEEPSATAMRPDTPQVCSGDDWLCWSRAQVNFLHTLANASAPEEGGGCVVVLTGDYHYGDIKIARPIVKPGQTSPPPPAAVQALRLDRLRAPIYQLMASGLTASTAREHQGARCEGSYREDLAGLRPLGKCSYVARPAFGAIEVDWQQRWFELSVRDAEGGGIAAGGEKDGGVRQRVRVSLDTCEVIEQG